MTDATEQEALYSWRLDGDMEEFAPMPIARLAADLVRGHCPELADLFPFCHAFRAESFLSDTWWAVRLIDAPTGAIPALGKFEPSALRELQARVAPFVQRSDADLRQVLGAAWIAPNRFTYVGAIIGGAASWDDCSQHVVDWLNDVALPEAIRTNRARVLRAIPAPPQFDIDLVRRSMWVLEASEHSVQGTAFALKGVGLVTCDHVLEPDTVAFQPEKPARHYPVHVIRRHERIDLAVFTIDADIQGELERGHPEHLRDADHMLIAGYPNFRHGDTGVVVPGLVVGFRTVSSVRRILTNAAIVAGASGGPVVDGDNKVIGVARSGSKLFATAEMTEDHAIVPIDALDLF